jgi:hypothetical protein
MGLDNTVTLMRDSDLGGIKQQAAGEICRARRLTMSAFYEIRQSDEIEKDRMGSSCRVHVRNKKCCSVKVGQLWDVVVRFRTTHKDMEICQVAVVVVNRLQNK